MSEEIHLKIEGMTCNHCVSAAKKALESVPGVEHAEVNLEPGSATVSGNAPTDLLVAAIKTAGYTATPDQGRGNK